MQPKGSAHPFHSNQEGRPYPCPPADTDRWVVVSTVGAAALAAAAAADDDAAADVGRDGRRLTTPTATTCTSKAIVVVGCGRRCPVAFMAKSKISPSFLKTDEQRA